MPLRATKIFQDPGQEDVLERILRHLDHKSLLATSAVCRNTNHLITTSSRLQLILRHAYYSLPKYYHRYEAKASNKERLHRITDIQGRWATIKPKRTDTLEMTDMWKYECNNGILLTVHSTKKCFGHFGFVNVGINDDMEDEEDDGNPDHAHWFAGPPDSDVDDDEDEITSSGMSYSSDEASSEEESEEETVPLFMGQAVEQIATPSNGGDSEDAQSDVPDHHTVPGPQVNGDAQGSNHEDDHGDDHGSNHESDQTASDQTASDQTASDHTASDDDDGLLDDVDNPDADNESLTDGDDLMMPPLGKGWTVRDIGSLRDAESLDAVPTWRFETPFKFHDIVISRSDNLAAVSRISIKASGQDAVVKYTIYCYLLVPGEGFDGTDKENVLEPIPHPEAGNGGVIQVSHRVKGGSNQLAMLRIRMNCDLVLGPGGSIMVVSEGLDQGVLCNWRTGAIRLRFDTRRNYGPDGGFENTFETDCFVMLDPDTVLAIGRSAQCPTQALGAARPPAPGRGQIFHGVSVQVISVAESSYEDNYWFRHDPSDKGNGGSFSLPAEANTVRRSNPNAVRNISYIATDVDACVDDDARLLSINATGSGGGMSEDVSYVATIRLDKLLPRLAEWVATQKKRQPATTGSPNDNNINSWKSDVLPFSDWVDLLDMDVYDFSWTQACTTGLKHVTIDRDTRRRRPDNVAGETRYTIQVADYGLRHNVDDLVHSWPFGWSKENINGAPLVALHTQTEPQLAKLEPDAMYALSDAWLTGRSKGERLVTALLKNYEQPVRPMPLEQKLSPALIIYRAIDGPSPTSDAGAQWDGIPGHDSGTVLEHLPWRDMESPTASYTTTVGRVTATVDVIADEPEIAQDLAQTAATQFAVDTDIQLGGLDSHGDFQYRTTSYIEESPHINVTLTAPKRTKPSEFYVGGRRKRRFDTFADLDIERGAGRASVAAELVVPDHVGCAHCLFVGPEHMILCLGKQLMIFSF